MKAQELRIGNWVQCQAAKKGWINVRVAELKSNELHSTFIDGMPNIFGGYDVFVPIPLTEEWLFNLGFQKSHDQGVNIVYRSPEVDLRGNFWKGFRLIIGEEYAWNKRYLYVHELQNLYFALTGEELTLTSPAKHVSNFR